MLVYPNSLGTAAQVNGISQLQRSKRGDSELTLAIYNNCYGCCKFTTWAQRLSRHLNPAFTYSAKKQALSQSSLNEWLYQMQMILLHSAIERSRCCFFAAALLRNLTLQTLASWAQPANSDKLQLPQPARSGKPLHQAAHVVHVVKQPSPSSRWWS